VIDNNRALPKSGGAFFVGVHASQMNQQQHASIRARAHRPNRFVPATPNFRATL
jgi:hypothetical protein